MTISSTTRQSGPVLPSSRDFLPAGSERVRNRWVQIKADYLDGQMSIREIARHYDVPESTIRSKAAGWADRKPAKHITDAELIAAGGRPIGQARP